MLFHRQWLRVSSLRRNLDTVPAQPVGAESRVSKQQDDRGIDLCSAVYYR